MASKPLATPIRRAVFPPRKRSVSTSVIRATPPEGLLKLISAHDKLVSREECKRAMGPPKVPPTSLGEKKEPPHPVSLLPFPQSEEKPTYIKVAETESSVLLKHVAVAMFGDRTYPFRISSAVSMSSNGTGIVNSVISAATLGTLAEFSPFSALFNEFFITSFHISWEPVSMYNGPIGFVNATNVASLPITVVDIQHGAGPYPNYQAATNNFKYAHHNTGRPFKYKWTNTEKPGSHTNPFPVAGTNPTQSWCLTADADNYTGQIQIISPSAPPGLPTSVALGNFFVDYYVLFRLRQ